MSIADSEDVIYEQLALTSGLYGPVLARFQSYLRRRQGRPVNVKHDAMCIMGKVGGRQNPKEGEF